MKGLLFNMYKVWFVHFTRKSKDEPDWLDRFSASGGIFLFLFLIGMNMCLLYFILFNIPGKTPNKPLMWLSILFGIWLVDLLLFKVLGLKNLDYKLPENKPARETIKKIWRIFLVPHP